VDDSSRDFAAVTSELRRRADGYTNRLGENVRTLQAQLEAISRGDLESVLACAADDVTLEIFAPPEFPFVRQASGAAAFRAALQANFEAVGDQTPEVRDVFAEGDKVVLFGRETGIVRATGLRYDLEFVERFTFRSAKLVAVQIIAAHAKAQSDLSADRAGITGRVR
jgi:ketosteroid isomerase-like protein